MPSSLRVALIGYGLAGRTFHAPLIRATDGLALAAVVSSDAAKVHADLPDVAVVSDLADALADETVDLVVIATPDHLHADHAIAALDAGKHVVIDKPFAPHLEDARRVAARAAASDRTLAIFQNRRWDADFLTLKRLIREGTLGDIVQLESHFDRYRPEIRRGWKGERDGGLWQDLGPHLIDQALDLFGMPHAVFADLAAQRQGGVAPDYAHVLLRYPTLRVILHASQSTHEGSLRFAVHGTKGSFNKYGLDPQEAQAGSGLTPDDADWGLDSSPGTLTAIDGSGQAQVTPVESERGNYPAFYEAVRDAIWARGANPVTPEQALSVMTVLDAGIRSAKERREIAIEPQPVD
ncbi:oxidoreductase [Sphingobium sp. H39-3-25]|uniref:oxidoreductase n=1 Tax=Sphingobium arseniciresistens TaxID=3030834 RepID=UPI0023B95A15|nr:oxidoreductase [Sphingobium arseniciresistens]